MARIVHSEITATIAQGDSVGQEDTIMKQSLFAAFGAVAVAGTLTLAAQTPTPSAPSPQTPTPSPSTSSRTDDKTMTLTGCLKPHDTAMGAGRPTSPPSAGTAADGTFVLTNVQGDSMGTSKPDTTTTGSTMPSASSKSSDKQYTLIGDAGVNLAAHVNHQVRVTGRLSEMGTRSMPHSNPAATAGESSKPGSTGRPGESSQSGDRMDMDKAGATLAVSSVTMISNSCTATQ